MPRLVLDSGGLSRLAERSTAAVALIEALRANGAWPPQVPSIVLVESLRGHAGYDARVNRMLKACLIEESLPAGLVRRAARLRTRASTGSATDAVVVALAEPDALILTQDEADLRALAPPGVRIAVV